MIKCHCGQKTNFFGFPAGHNRVECNWERERRLQRERQNANLPRTVYPQSIVPPPIPQTIIHNHVIASGGDDGFITGLVAGELLETNQHPEEVIINNPSPVIAEPTPTGNGFSSSTIDTSSDQSGFSSGGANWGDSSSASGFGDSSSSSGSGFDSSSSSSSSYDSGSSSGFDSSTSDSGGGW